MTRVLVLDDDPGLRQSLGLLLGESGFEVVTEGDPERGLARALAEPFDVVLCDIKMPKLDGREFLRRYKEREGSALVVMMSAHGNEELAIDAMREGAYDYLHKPFRPAEVILTLRKAEEREGLRREVAVLRATLETGGAALVAESVGMRQVLDLATRAAAHATTVLLTGESGTGKEVVARFLHRQGPRAAERFVAVNCAAIPEALLESELFGHRRGAFTGATEDRRGLFEEANRGTLLLDEIAELSVALQAKLLGRWKRAQYGGWGILRSGRWTSVSSPRPRSRWKSGSATDAFAKTSSTGSTSSGSTSRRSGSAPRISRRSPPISSRRRGRDKGGRSASPPPRWCGSPNGIGPATCANCGTPSSGRRCSRPPGASTSATSCSVIRANRGRGPVASLGSSPRWRRSSGW